MPATWLTSYLKDSSTPRNDSDVDGHILGSDFDVDDAFSKQFIEVANAAAESESETGRA